ncbi:MAG: hypothetical protein H7222_01540 [Methylotenera sp.]|nr:hypothetical protein [Oligoflexia bacterium]
MKPLHALFIVEALLTLPGATAHARSGSDFHHPLSESEAKSLKLNPQVALKAAAKKSLSTSVASIQKQLNAVKDKSQCPQSFRKWNDWRAFYLNNLQSPADLATDNLLDECRDRPDQKDFFNDSRFSACMKSIRDIKKPTAALVKSDGAEFTGMFEDPVDPVNADGSRLTDLPDALHEMKLIRKLTSKSFKPASGEYKTLIQTTLSKMPQGWEAISYLASNTGCNTVIFVKSGPDKDQYVHFDSCGKTDAIALTIRTHDEKGQTIYSPDAYFKFFKGSNKPQTNAGRCILCHRAGAIPVAADPKQPVVSYSTRVYPEGVLNWLNHSVISQTGDAHLAKQDTMDLHLPQLGPASTPSRTDAFIERCAGSKLAPERREGIKKAMNCASCHDGGVVGKVGYVLRPETFASTTIDTLLRAGLMPPGSHGLLAEDREILIKCLHSEYFGGFKDESLGGAREQGSYLADLARVPCPTSENTPTAVTDRNQKNLNAGSISDPAATPGQSAAPVH